MMTLEFRDELVNNRWSYGNSYSYSNVIRSGILYPKDYKELPFILRNGLRTSSDGDILELKYSISRQLNGRVLTTARLKEILDGPKMPLLFRIGTIDYLIGKGFLAKWDRVSNDIEVLFLAVTNTVTVSSMSEVKFYVSRKLYLLEHKKVYTALKDILTLHVGETVITSSIDKYVGVSINLPTFTTLAQKKKFVSNLVDKCLELSFKNFKPLKITKKPIDKKKKEAEILEAIRGEVRATVLTISGTNPEETTEAILEPIVLPPPTVEITYSADTLPIDHQDYDEDYDEQDGYEEDDIDAGF